MGEAVVGKNGEDVDESTGKCAKEAAKKEAGGGSDACFEVSSPGKEGKIFLLRGRLRIRLGADNGGGFYWVSVQAASSSGTGGGQEPDDDGGDWIKILDFGKEDQQGEVVDEESYYPGSEDWKDGSKKNMGQLKIIKEEVKGEEKEGEYEYEAELFVGGEKKGNDGKKIKIKIKESKDDGPPVVQNDNELASSLDARWQWWLRWWAELKLKVRKADGRFRKKMDDKGFSDKIKGGDKKITFIIDKDKKELLFGDDVKKLSFGGGGRPSSNGGGGQQPTPRGGTEDVPGGRKGSSKTTKENIINNDEDAGGRGNAGGTTTPVVVPDDDSTKEHRKKLGEILEDEKSTWEEEAVVGKNGEDVDESTGKCAKEAAKKEAGGGSDACFEVSSPGKEGNIFLLRGRLRIRLGADNGGGFYWVSVQAASSSGTGGGQEPDDDGGDWIKILDFGKEDQQGEVVDEESYYPGSEDWKDGSKKNLNQQENVQKKQQKKKLVVVLMRA